MARRLRSATREPSAPVPRDNGDKDSTKSNLQNGPVSSQGTRTQNPTELAIKLVSPDKPRLPGLDAEETRILRKKQRRLRVSASSISASASEFGVHIHNALCATFILAQHEAGTAVCIDQAGWILTCAHCFGESEEEWRRNRRKWLLSYTGLAVQVECRVWDARRDLALGRVVCLEGLALPGEFAFVSLPPLEISGSYTSTSARTPILCIGQPGADDLESEIPQKTDFDLIEISSGRLRGMVVGTDPQDNSEIGTLKHDAWTYWGHSGAPLLCRKTGALLGLHSSWDDQTAMRHGVPLVAILEFLRTHLRGEEEAPGPSEAKELEPEVIVID
ncbi:S1 family peptidase [Aspergillus lucknowensis]|uniref:Trypsin-like cysteine/serine peptidase domain-containing protein n=1 Tax=Aspergillus lucknowensis TaxID=176173 RepID=A0ABR4LYX6_9EURO